MDRPLSLVRGQIYSRKRRPRSSNGGDSDHGESPSPKQIKATADDIKTEPEQLATPSKEEQEQVAAVEEDAGASNDGESSTRV